MYALLLSLLLAPSVPVFPTTSKIVNVTLTVTDPAGNYVDGLNARDFQVYENGLPQDVAIFERQTDPVDVVVMIDTSASMGALAGLTKKSALGFVSNLRPEDRVRIVTFSTESLIIQDWTTDHDKLAVAINSVLMDGQTYLYRSLYDVTYYLRNTAQENDRRCIIVLLTDGEDTDSANLVSDDRVLRAVQRLGILIYPIELPHGRDDDELGQKAHFFLSQLAQMTGGRLATLREAQEMFTAYRQVAEELRVQYRLGYQPKDRSPDGSWRTISVVIDRPHTDLRYRRGYYAVGR